MTKKVEFWRMGATPVPCTSIREFAREFESSGWDGLAVGEAHGLLPDPHVLLGLAAAATTTLKVGTAGAVKVLQQKPMRVADFDAYLQRLQGFLQRGPVEIDGVAATLARQDDIDPSLAVDKPPVDVAATGPRTLALAARSADGVNFSVGADVERLKRSIDLAHDACREAGRDPDELELGCFVQVALTDKEDDSAREAIRGLVVTHARFSGFEAKPTGDVGDIDHGKYRHAVETMEAIYRDARGGVTRTAGGVPGEIDFYPRAAGADDLIDQFAIAGPAEYCAARLQEIVDLGISRIYIGTRAVGVDLAERNAIRIGREVLPLVRTRVVA
jgi:5,10-methylenetetrahydromethanopterin reductase